MTLTFPLKSETFIVWMIAGIEKCGVNGPTGSRYPLTRTHNRWRFNMSSHMDTVCGSTATCTLTWTLSVVQQKHVLSHGHCQWFNRRKRSMSSHGKWEHLCKRLSSFNGTMTPFLIGPPWTWAKAWWRIDSIRRYFKAIIWMVALLLALKKGL